MDKELENSNLFEENGVPALLIQKETLAFKACWIMIMVIPVSWSETVCPP